jgi:4-hydroxy-3-polyprenylbenzoate decarboxylase
MPYRDLRDFIQRLERERDLHRIDVEVDWKYEIGCIARRVKDLKAPCPLFEKIRDYPGQRLLAVPFSPTDPVPHGRLNLALDLPKETPAAETIEEFLRRTRVPIKPTLVKDAPCKENVVVGKDVNLLAFPVPWIHGKDGGRYFGTWHATVMKDPDSGWVNWAIYRIMVHDPKTLTILIQPVGQHGGGIFFPKYAAKGKAMPVALALGVDPAVNVACFSSFPAGVNEVDMAGALRGAPVPVVRCETLDLEVPASAEIVIEGEIPANRRELEGPFGEYTGYVGGGRSLLPVIEVKCITHRNQPIFTMSNLSRYETPTCFAIASSAIALKVLRESGIPARSVYTQGVDLTVVSVPKRVSAQKVAYLLWGSPCRAAGAQILIVDEDIDPSNIDEVMWAFTTRLNPRTSIHVVPGPFFNSLMPWNGPEERATRESKGVFFDARFPSHWPEEYLQEHASPITFETGWPQEVSARVLDRWKEYGYGD